MSLSSSARATLVVLSILLAAAFPGPADALRYDPPILIPAISHIGGVAIADVNRDGRLDVVTANAAAGVSIGVSLQREDGQFDPPITADCQCRHGTIYAVTQDEAARPLILTVGDHGFVAYQLKPDNTLSIVQYFDPFIGENTAPDDVTMVDANQDGLEDIFHTYLDEDSTTPEIEFRYSLWYQGSGRDKVPGERDATRGGFFQYVSDRFRYSGINDIRDTFTPSLAIRVDLDADGYNDAIEGKCPDDCFYKQQPYRQLTARTLAYTPSAPVYPYARDLADLDDDGLPDLVWSPGGQLNASAGARIYLQDVPEHFQEVAEYGPLYGPSNPVIADMDNDGRNDIVIASMDPSINYSGWLDVLLQTAPGQLDLNTRRLYNVDVATRIEVVDLDGDGCRDIVRFRNLPHILATALDVMYGRDCLPATDLSVRVSGAPEAPMVEVKRLVGTAPTSPRVVRVTLAPAVHEAASVGFAVAAPADCIETPAEAPRRMYDCALPSLAANGATTFPFALSLAPDKTVDVQVNAFLLSKAGDVNTDNNLSRWRATLSTVTHQGRTP